MPKHRPTTRPLLTSLRSTGLHLVFALAIVSIPQAVAASLDYGMPQLHHTTWPVEQRALDDFQLHLGPDFLQTQLFSWLCIAAAALMLRLLYQLRLTQALRRMRSFYQERLLERERVARQLQDRMLQGLQGLIFEFHGALSRLDEASPGRRQMGEALNRANRMLAEGRDRMQGLRTGGTPGGNLTDAVTDLARGLGKDYPCAIRITAEGGPRELNPDVQEEVHRIVGEALLNTLNHAAATDIELNIVVSRKHLQVHLRDNGIGIPKDVMHAGRKPGRWGLPGMRERANSICGQFAIHSQPGNGTEVNLLVPASVAFRPPGRLAPRARVLDHFVFTARSHRP